MPTADKTINNIDEIAGEYYFLIRELSRLLIGNATVEGNRFNPLTINISHKYYDNKLVFYIHVPRECRGRLIGRGGETAQTINRLIAACGKSSHDLRVSFSVQDDE